MRIEILLKDASQPKKYDNVKDVFQEGNLLCVLMDDKIDKYNMSNIYRIREYLVENKMTMKDLIEKLDKYEI